MCKVKSLVYLTSREAFYHSCGIINNFNWYSQRHCLCFRFAGCVREPSAKKNYCAICRISQHCSLERLNEIKQNSFELANFYLNILRNVAEALSLDPSIYFWKSDYYNRICTAYFKESNEIEYMDFFRENLDHFFSSKNIEWNLIEVLDHYRTRLKFCYRTIENFLSRAHYCCLCGLYQGY